jgi:hypothetical protein
MLDNKLSDYKKLTEKGILNSKIEDEYGHLVGAEKYNL